MSFNMGANMYLPKMAKSKTQTIFEQTTVTIPVPSICPRNSFLSTIELRLSLSEANLVIACGIWIDDTATITKTKPWVIDKIP